MYRVQTGLQIEYVIDAEAKPPLQGYLAHRKDGEPSSIDSPWKLPCRRGGPGFVHVAGPARCMLRVMAHTYIHVRLNMFCFSRVLVHRSRRTCAAFRSVALSVALQPLPSQSGLGMRASRIEPLRQSCRTGCSMPNAVNDFLYASMRGRRYYLGTTKEVALRSESKWP
jgi:hypothetical protein